MFTRYEKADGFLKGLIIGGLVASTVSLLYAPKSGKRLRRDIRKKSSDLTNEAQVSIKDVQKKSEYLLSDTEKRLNRAVKNLESMMIDVKQKLS